MTIKHPFLSINIAQQAMLLLLFVHKNLFNYQFAWVVMKMKSQWFFFNVLKIEIIFILDKFYFLPLILEWNIRHAFLPKHFPGTTLHVLPTPECVYNVHKAIQNKNVICLALLLICFSLSVFLRLIIEKEGPRSLFRGLGPNLIGVAPSRWVFVHSYS